MTPDVAVFLVVGSLALLVVPRRYAALVLLVGTCYMTRGQAIDFGPLTFNVLHILVVVGLVRIVVRREGIGGLNTLDSLMFAWGVWMVASVAFHTDPSNQVIVRLRHVFSGWGLYVLFRAFCRSRDEMRHLAGLLALVLAPIAASMLLEKATGRNMFAAFGGVPAFSAVRDGSIRAQGPFAHAVLAGSIGAVSLPFIVGLWPVRPKLATWGICASLVIVMASASSGPALSAIAGIGGLILLKLRHNMRAVRWAAVLIYVALDLVMNRPAYFIVTSLGMTGGGWHRARLIRASIEYLHDWWATGTDYTRHWIASGVTWSPDHVDITNHYIALGVLGGLPLMLLFIAILFKAFWFVGEGMQKGTDSDKFIVWANGAALFAHAATCLSVSYFDNSITFLYLSIALTCAGRAYAAAPQAMAVDTPTPSTWRRPTMTWQPHATFGSRALNGGRQPFMRHGAHPRVR